MGGGERFCQFFAIFRRIRDDLEFFDTNSFFKKTLSLLYVNFYKDLYDLKKKKVSDMFGEL